MNLPILRMIASSHKTPIVSRSKSRFIDPTSIRPFMAAGAFVLRLDDDGVTRGASGSVDDRIVVASAFRAFHGGLLTGFLDQPHVVLDVLWHGSLAVLDQNLVDLAVLNLHHVDERIDERECLDVVQ